MSGSFWDAEGPIAIAHRGGDGAGKARQNTLQAYQSAADKGFQYAEADVILAASGELVVVHGSHNWLHAGFSRGITSGVLQLMTLDQLRYLVKPGGEQVPLLEEVLRSFPKMKFVLDIKTDEVISPLAKKLKQLKALDRICISGYEYGRSLKFIEYCGKSRIAAGLTVGRGVRFRNMNLLMLKSGRLSGVEAIFMHHSLVSPPMVSLIHRRGFKAAVWTVNSSIGIKNAVKSGADAVISDRTVLLEKLSKPHK